MNLLLIVRHSLGFYILFLELCHCQSSGSGGKWPDSEVHSSLRGVAATQSNSHLLGHIISSLQLPQIHSPQTKLTVQIGDTIRLPCKVYNIGESHLLWKHGSNVLVGTNVSSYIDPRISLFEDYTLKIMNIRREDEGDYQCIVASAFLPEISLVHSVVVYDPPSITMLTSTNVVVNEGESIEIGCTPHGFPLPKITWSWREKPIPIPKNLLNQSNIKLENITRAFTGLYVCTCDNGIGRPVLGAVYIRVLFPPQIEISKRRAHSGVGYSAQLVALVHGDPKPQVQWLKGDSPVETNEGCRIEQFGSNEQRLTFKSVKLSDFGSYTIKAENSLGADAKTIEFTGVPNDPILTRWETEKVGGLLQSTLHWTVECYSPLIDYKLYFREAVLPRGEGDPRPWTKLTIPGDKSSSSFLHTQSFSLRGLTNDTIYEAAVKARNRYGESQLSSVCYFATFPYSSSSKPGRMEKVLNNLSNDSSKDFVDWNKPGGNYMSVSSGSICCFFCGNYFNGSVVIMIVALLEHTF